MFLASLEFVFAALFLGVAFRLVEADSHGAWFVIAVAIVMVWIGLGEVRDSIGKGVVKAIKDAEDAKKK
jgi:hypothetical protein